MTLLYRLCLPFVFILYPDRQIMSRQSNSLLYKHGGLRLVAAGRPSRWQQICDSFLYSCQILHQQPGITL